MYDVNPIPDGASLSLNVSEEDNSLSIDLAVKVAEQFMIPQKEAAALANEIVVTVRDNWRKIAEKNGLSKSSIEYMKSAFAFCYE